MHAKALQSCPTLCNPMDCSPPGSFAQGILQARILEWVVMPSSRRSSWPREQTCVSAAPALQADSLQLSHWGYVYIYLLLLAPPPPSTPSLGHHRAPSWAPFAVQRLPTSCLFYTWWRMHVSAAPSVSSPHALGPQVHSLHLHLCSCPAMRSSCTIFLDSTYMPCCLVAAAAKSLQSCPTLCDPIDGSPPGSAVPRILQARTLEWVAIAFSIVWKWKVKVKLLSRARLVATPWTSAYQAPPSMGFSRQEYWSGLPLPTRPLHPWDFLGKSTGVACHCHF